MNRFTRSYYDNSFFKFVQCHWQALALSALAPVFSVFCLYSNHVLTVRQMIVQIICTIGLFGFILICLIVKWRSLND
jgi:hypothetical protein